VEAVAHARAAGDGNLAARALDDHWPGLQAGGQGAVVRETLAGFPAGAALAGAEPAAVAAANGQVVSRPALFERLGASARVTVVSGPAGSGKTVLLRSWIAEAGLAGHAAWVPAERDDRDPQRFWLSVLRALRQTGPGSALVRALTAAPDLDGWELAERLLKDLAPLADRLWLVIDDIHELEPEVLRQLELLIMRAPPPLCFVLASRHDVRLDLHRLRLVGELAEIRAADLRFTAAEAGMLLAAAGAELPAPALAVLLERTEGWAAGLRLAALALARHPDPERFAAEFSGSERTVAGYLLAEVLDRQPEPVRRLLMRTSVLGRVNGELADLLTGDQGGERVLQDLEQAGAFTVSLDAGRSWFRYHQMFAGLLALELRRTTPGEVTGLHRAAAGWLAEHGDPVEAIRHAQAAHDWDRATRLLAGHWPALHLDGQDAVVHELLAGFPAGLLLTEAELAVVAAADKLARGTLAAAERFLGLAEQGSLPVPEDRQGQLRLLLGVVDLLLARQRGNLPAAAAKAERLQAMADDAGTAPPDLEEDLRALALISLGATEFWAARFEEAQRHLARGVALARRIGRPYLEFTGLAYQSATVDRFWLAADYGRQAAELAGRHGWTLDPAYGVACMALGHVLVDWGKLDEAEPWIQRAERTLRAETQPAESAGIRFARGTLEMARDRTAEALAAFQATELLVRRLAAPHYLLPRIRAVQLHTLVRAGETERAGQILAALSEPDRSHSEIRIAAAALWIARGDPRAALAALVPVLDGSLHDTWRSQVQACLLAATAHDALRDPAAAEDALERALDLAEPDGELLPFLLYLAPGLLERHTRHRTSHAGLIAEITSQLAAKGLAPQPGLQPPREPLSDSELRVLRYLPTNLTAPEVARELSVSLNTIKSHMRNLYAKLGTHRRAEAVERARALGLLAPSGAGRPKPATPAPP
jgi:LuxR family transcriptional regulator, maltose regulon positive regulatory protein